MDPKFREKLIKEAQNPFKGLRRVVWLVLFASASLGLLIMLSRVSIGESMSLIDGSIQLGALIIFGGLLFFDRDN